MQSVRILPRPASLITFPGRYYGLAPRLEFKKFAPSVRSIARIAAALCHVNVEDMLGHRRWKELVRARALTVWAARTMRPDMSYPMIAAPMNRSDHTTLIYQFDLAVKWRVSDPDFLDLCNELVAIVSADA